MSEAKQQELDDLNIKCLQLLRALIHNEERKLPDDWETRTSETRIKKYVDQDLFVMKIFPVAMNIYTSIYDVLKYDVWYI